MSRPPQNPFAALNIAMPLGIAMATTMALVFVMAFAGPAPAGEVLIPSFAQGNKYAPMWPGGTYQTGRDAGFSFGKIVSDGKAGASLVSNVRPYHPTIDATGKFVKVWIKVDDVAKLGGMEFRLSSDRFKTNYFAFGFPLYADLEFNILKNDVWTVVTFSFGEAQVKGEPDRSKINAIGWYVSDKGGDVPVTAYWGGMALVDEPTEGVVTFTFDDGYAEQHLAAEIMAEYGFRGTAYIIPNSIGEKGYLTLHQVVDLQETFKWDIASHHEIPFTDMTHDKLEDTLLGILRFMQDNQLGRGAAHLAYPLGRQDEQKVRPLVRKYFTTARVAGAGPESLPAADAHLLRAFNVTNTIPPAEVEAAAIRARENGEWLILMFHHLVDKTSFSTQYTIKDFRDVVQKIAGTKIRVLPLTDVWEACGIELRDPNTAPPCSFTGRATGTFP